MTKRNELTISRRSLMAGIGAVAGAAVPGAALAANRETQWDRETDIVCVGGGAAGCTAAVIAADNGSEVTLVDKAPILGGTSRKSGGATWIPNHFLLRAQGVDDNKEDCLRYMSRFAFPQSYSPESPTLGLDPLSYRLLEAFYDNGSAMIDHLRKIGVMEFEQHTLGEGGHRRRTMQNTYRRTRCAQVAHWRRWTRRAAAWRAAAAAAAV